MKCQIVVAVDIVKMGNAFACKVSPGNSANKVISHYKILAEFTQA